MTGSANYGTYETTEDEIDTFLRHSIKPFMKRRLSEIDSLRAKNEHLQHALMCAETDRDHAISELDAAIKGRNTWHDKWEATDRALGEATANVERADEVLIDGTDYVPWADLPKYAENHVKALREARRELKDLHVAIAEFKPDTLPRVITADELKLGSGQWIAYKSYTHDDLWIAEKYDMDAFSPGYNGTIVLLADAPDTKDINVAKETVKGEYPDNPWFATVYEDDTYLAATWRGTPVRPQSIRTGDLYDIHTAHGSRITGVVAARNGVRNPQSGDQYRLVNRKA